MNIKFWGGVRQTIPKIDCRSWYRASRLVCYVVPFLANQYASTQKWKWTRNDPKRSASMAMTLNRQAYEHAEELIEEGTFVFRRARCMERAPAVRTGAK